MNSYQAIISELIKQKQILDEKGFAVNVANINPSPSEITSAIEKINFDFSAANATEADVAEGKTFYAQNNELKVGTFSMGAVSQLEQTIRALVAGDVSTPCTIPDYCTKIRPYAFYFSKAPSGVALFEQENLIIPSQVTEIGEYAFRGCKITNKLVVPEGCVVGSHSFSTSTMKELEFAGKFTSNATYPIAYCENLLKATILPPCNILPKYCFNDCDRLQEIYLPDTLNQIHDYALYYSYSIKLIKFTKSTPPIIGKNTLRDCPTAKLLVPYLSYSAYYNGTNYLYNNNPIIGYGNFNTGDTLPATVNDETVVWYATSDDAAAQTNPITICPETGEMYLRYPLAT